MLVIFFIIIGIFARLLPHPANFTPIGAIALFSGRYLDKRLAIVVPVITMAFSDFILGWHSTMSYVYGSILLTSMIGIGLRGNKGDKKIRGIIWGTLLSSTLFFLITNFGVWRETSLYPKTFDGLLQSYIMALPFFRNSMLGDLFYTAVFFGGYEIVRLKIQPSLRV